MPISHKARSAARGRSQTVAEETMSVDQTQEREANYFAMCLLMPESFLRADLQKMGGIDLCDPDPLLKLAKRYGVSPAMMAIRIGMLFKDSVP